MKNFIILIAMILMTNTVYGMSQKADKVIYGPDNRIEYSATTDVRRLLADATAAMVPKKNVNGSSRYSYVCRDEAFYNQRTLAVCSGFLVAPDKIATAGHCIKSQADCRNYLWVFNYNDKNDQMKQSDIYQCDRILGRHLDNKVDYAVIQLKRKNEEVSPLVMASEEPKNNDSLFVIGHPSGLPTKIADGATVRSSNSNFFLANLDTYGGNSGSAVFNDKNEVQGILVRGYTDFRYDSRNQCQRSMRCSDTGCSGEGVTHIKFVNKVLNK